MSVSKQSKFYTLLNDFIEGNDFSEHTKRAYKTAITRFLEYAKPWDSKGWMQRATKWRSTLDLAPSSQFLYVVAARRYLGECVYKKLISENPLSRVRVKVEAYGIPRRNLTDEEVGKLLKTATGDGLLQVRDSAIIILMLHTGIRIGAVAEVRIEDINLVPGEKTAVLKYKCKGHKGKDTHVVLSLVVVDAIGDYLTATDRSFKDKGWLFVSKGNKRLTVHALRKMIIRRMDRAGVRSGGVCIHSLRHTAATKAVESGQPLLKVRDMLGHKSVQTTELYVHQIRRMQDAAELGIDYGIKRKRRRKK